jgi:hypothetical protein
VSDEAKPSLRIAGDYRLRQHLALRASFAKLDSWEQSYMGAGLLFKQETFTIEYGFSDVCKKLECAIPRAGF